MSRDEGDPDDVALAALAEKYELLGELRRSRERGDPPPTREAFRALATAFPGALFELETLTLDVIEARALALRAASRSTREDRPDPEPWMRWMARYHALVRAELTARKAGREISGPRARATSLAIATIATEAGTSKEAIESALFARKRRGVSR